VGASRGRGIAIHLSLEDSPLGVPRMLQSAPRALTVRAVASVDGPMRPRKPKNPSCVNRTHGGPLGVKGLKDLIAWAEKEIKHLLGVENSGEKKRDILLFQSQDRN